MKRNVVHEGEGPRRRAGTGVYSFVLLGLTLGALGHVAVQAKQVEVAGLLAQERAAHEALLAERRRLEIELGRLRDPARLVKVAQEKLGMTPEPGDIRRLVQIPEAKAP